MRILLLISVLLASSPAQAADQSLLYAGQNTMPEGWWGLSWGGTLVIIEPNCAAPKQQGSLAILARDENEAWSGGGIQKAPGGKPFPLPSQNWADSFLQFKVNGGVRPDGTREGGQAFKVSVKLIDAEGNSLPAPPAEKGGEFISVTSDMIAGERIDDDPDSWQQVLVPLKRFAPPPGHPEPAAFVSFAIQFDSVKPTSGIYVTDIGIFTKTDPSP